MDEESKEMCQSNDDNIIEDKFLNIIYKRENYEYKIGFKYIIYLFIMTVFLLSLKNYNYFMHYFNKNKGNNKSSQNHDDSSRNEKNAFTSIFNINNNITSNNSFINEYYKNKTIYLISKNHIINREFYINSNIGTGFCINSFNLILQNITFNKIINFITYK